MKNVIESGLFNKWKQVYWAQNLRNIKKFIKQKDNQNGKNHLSLNQVSFVFYILLYCLPILISILLIEFLSFMVKIVKINKQR